MKLSRPKISNIMLAFRTTGYESKFTKRYLIVVKFMGIRHRWEAWAINEDEAIASVRKEYAGAYGTMMANDHEINIVGALDFYL